MRAKSASVRIVIALSSFALVASGSISGCSDDVDDDPTNTTTSDTSVGDTSGGDTVADTGGADTVADTNADTTDVDDGDVDLAITARDFLTNDPLEGALLTLGDQSVTTDADGRATLRVTPGADIMIALTGEGFRDHFIYRRAPATDAGYIYTIATDSTIEVLSALIGLAVDDADGIISISPRVAGSDASIPGMTITTDAASDLTMVMDVGSNTGLSAGNVTLAGSSSTAIIVNVAAGDVTPSFAHPDGYVCDVGPSPVAVPAGAYVIASYECHVPPVDVTIHLRDFVSRAPIEGASVAIGEVTRSTDAIGNATFQLPPNAEFMATVTGDGFRDHYLHNRARATNVILGYDMATDATVEVMQALLSVTLDEADGILSTAVFDHSANAIGGMTIDLDVASDLAVALDAGAAAGVSAGHTTIDGSPPTVIFVNTAAGVVTPSFSHPWGYVCDGASPVDVPAGSHVIATYRCAYTPIDVTLRLQDFLSGAALEGAEVEVGDVTQTADADGDVTFAMPPNADFMATVTGEGFRDHHIYRQSGAASATYTYQLATDTTVATLEGVLGTSVDDSDGLISVVARGPAGESIPGMTVTLDVASDLSLVLDSASGTGLSAGNVTLAGSSSTVIFVNAAAGDVTPSFSHADGHECVGPAPVDLPAGAYVIANYRCAVPADE